MSDTSETRTDVSFLDCLAVGWLEAASRLVAWPTGLDVNMAGVEVTWYYRRWARESTSCPPQAGIQYGDWKMEDVNGETWTISTETEPLTVRYKWKKVILARENSCLPADGMHRPRRDRRDAPQRDSQFWRA